MKTSRSIEHPCYSAFHHSDLYRQQGASLIVSLVMLMAVLMLGTSAAQIALQGEKASRNDRDRQIALLAAEAALVDAELDIEHSARSHLFGRDGVEGFDAECGAGQHDSYRGLCASADRADMPVWKILDLAGNEGQAKSVPYGHFTGKTIQTGNGPVPVKPPRYIVERISYAEKQETAAAVDSSCFYRITAIGFGTRETTQVVLQSLYRKHDGGHSDKDGPVGRFSWREIVNWQELRNVSG